MSRTLNFRRQHNEMLALVDEIGLLLKQPLDETSGRQLYQTFLKLTGKLKIHLIQEDESLYPNVIGGSNSRASQIADKFQKEMGDFSQQYHAFSEKWKSASQLVSDQQVFANESGKIFSQLKGRIQRENAELYPIVDSL